MSEPCEELRASSDYVRRWMDRQPGVKEESLTDWLLYDISQRLPYVHYLAFSRHQEARETGADWEWWIIYPKRSIRLRVQAKKVFANKDNYPELARTNRYGLQIDKLLSDAASANAIPLYALYSPAHGQTMCAGSRNHQDGVFLAGAKRINTDFIAGARQQVSSTDLLSRSNPFSCFNCCPLSHGKAEGAISYFGRYYTDEALADGNQDGAIVGVHTELPGYVASLLQYAQEGVPEWWEREFAFATVDFEAILIYDFRATNR